MEKKNSYQEISRLQKMNDFCLIFYYKFPHSLTSNLFKKEFSIKFYAPLKAFKDYLDFTEDPDYHSLTYYDNILITFIEEIIDLNIIRSNFSEIRAKFNDNINLYELNFRTIHEKLLPLTSELIIENFQKKKKSLSLDFIFTQISLTLQLSNIVDLRKFN